MPTIRTAEVNIATNDDERRIDLDLLEERREQAAIREEKAKLKMKGHYDAKVRGVSFRPGDFVYRANDASHAEDTGKLGPKWEGPYEVTEALGKGAYKLRDMEGRELPRTTPTRIILPCPSHPPFLSKPLWRGASKRLLNGIFSRAKGLRIMDCHEDLQKIDSFLTAFPRLPRVKATLHNHRKGLLCPLADFQSAHKASKGRQWLMSHCSSAMADYMCGEAPHHTQ
ncbi:hypothetical protein Tco_0916771 [Tanacetum coccineum]